MIKLTYFNIAGISAEFDRVHQKLYWKKSKDKEEYFASLGKHSGWILRILWKNYLFFRIEDSLFIGDKRSQVEIPPNAKATLQKHFLTLGISRTLKISENERTLFRVFSFAPIIFPPIGWDFTMSEKEDFDACVFISNIINDPSRKEIIGRTMEWRRENNML